MHTAHYLRNNLEFDDLSKANILHCLICIYINRFLEMKKEKKNKKIIKNWMKQANSVVIKWVGEDFEFRLLSTLRLGFSKFLFI